MTSSSSLDTKTLLFIVGPPAVGKMSVGHEIASSTGLKLFHNHLAIEPVLRFFDFGTPPSGGWSGNFADGCSRKWLRAICQG